MDLVHITGAVGTEAAHGRHSPAGLWGVSASSEDWGGRTPRSGGQGWGQPGGAGAALKCQVPLTVLSTPAPARIPLPALVRDIPQLEANLCPTAAHPCPWLMPRWVLLHHRGHEQSRWRKREFGATGLGPPGAVNKEPRACMAPSEAATWGGRGSPGTPPHQHPFPCRPRAPWRAAGPAAGMCCSQQDQIIPGCLESALLWAGGQGAAHCPLQLVQILPVPSALPNI